MKKSTLNAINALNTEKEIREAVDLLKLKFNQIREIQAHSVKSLLSVGAQVKVNSKKGPEFGEVTKINRTKAVVRIDGKLWNCPLGMLEVA
jgi:hypothetical protein